MRRWFLSIASGFWLFALPMSGMVQAQGTGDNNWIQYDVLPKLKTLKAKADKDLADADAKIKSAQKTIQKAQALEAQYRKSGDTTSLEGAKQVEDLGQRTLQKALAWKERILVNRQRAEKAVESVIYTMAHNLGGKAEAVCGGVTGDVKISRLGKFRDLYGADGDCLAPGDKIETGADGRIDLVMKDGHKLHLEPHSTLTFEEENVSYLDKGELAARKLALKMIIKKKFEVRTPTAICGVRGTEYSIQTSPEGTTVKVHEGSVEVWDLKKTQSVVVEAGFKVFAPVDGMPGTPEKDDAWKNLDWDAPIAEE